MQPKLGWGPSSIWEWEKPEMYLLPCKLWGIGSLERPSLPSGCCHCGVPAVARGCAGGWEQGGSSALVMLARGSHNGIGLRGRRAEGPANGRKTGAE